MDFAVTILLLLHTHISLLYRRCYIIRTTGSVIKENTCFSVLVDFSFPGLTAVLGRSLLFVEGSRSHLDTPHSVGLLWTSDQPDAQIYT